MTTEKDGPFIKINYAAVPDQLMEQVLILKTLAACKGNRTAAAEMLGVRSGGVPVERSKVRETSLSALRVLPKSLINFALAVPARK